MLLLDKPTFDPGPLISHRALQEGLATRPSNLDESTHRSAVERVAEMYKRCRAESTSVNPVYCPAGEWAVYIDERRALYDALVSSSLDQASDLLRNFWRNELGTIVKEYATFDQLTVGERDRTERFTHNVCRNYLIWRDMFRLDPAALEIPQVGSPWGYMIHDVLVAPKATRFHTLANQIAEITRGTHAPTIGEIGAGYGGMAFYLLRDNPRIRYVDFDLPETLVLAAYYMLCTHPRRSIMLHGEATVTDNFDAMFLPNFAIASWPDRSLDLVVNTFSFSEMTPQALSETLRQVTRTTRSYLLHHNMDRTGVVNRGSERIPASQFDIDPNAFRLLHKSFDLFHGHDGDYREFLYARQDYASC